METNDFLSYYSAWYDGWADELVRAVSDMAINSQAINDSMNEAAKKLVESMSGLFTEDYTKSLQASLSALAEKLGAIPIDELQTEPYISVPEEELEPFRKMEQFIPEAKREEFKEIVAPAKDKKKFLTPMNIITLLGVIFTFISMLNSFKPQEPQDLSDDSKKFIHEEFSRIIDALEPKFELNIDADFNVLFNSPCQFEDEAIDGPDVAGELIIPEGQNHDTKSLNENEDTKQ